MTRLLLVMFLGLAGLAACSDARSDAMPQPTPTLPAGIARVSDASQVCMVNDQFMGRPQIPVIVGGRTYYGCCQACKAKLENQIATRTARDPVSGESVDKATALIVQDAAGKVFYFASEDTLRRFRG